MDRTQIFLMYVQTAANAYFASKGIAAADASYYAVKVMRSAVEIGIQMPEGMEPDVAALDFVEFWHRRIVPSWAHRPLRPFDLP